MNFGEVVGARILAVICFVVFVQEAYVYLAPLSPRVLHLITAGATASFAVYLFHGSYVTLVDSLVGSSPATTVAVCVASLPVLFVVCYYIQKATDRLIAQVRHRRSVPSSTGGS